MNEMIQELIKDTLEATKKAANEAREISRKEKTQVRGMWLIFAIVALTGLIVLAYMTFS